MIPAELVAGIAGVLGLVIGSFLNVVAHRVPRGESVVSPPSACPRCGTPIRNRHNVPVLGWLVLRGRCYDCGLPISVRYPLVEAATGLVFALAGLRFADRPVLLAAYLSFAAIAMALALIDLDVRRLPNAIVLPAYPALAVLLALGADRHDLVRAGIGALVLFGFFFAVAIVAPGGLGFGDVKLAGVVGGMTAFLSWGAFLTGAFGGFLLGALAGVLLMAGRRAGRRTAVPFGPFMLLGAWASILGASGLGDVYLQRIGL
ncbi:A24 family peptidase [Nocardioides panacihumi]|uniref:A24 family peptidase n=1 Tax=Nocardioides panacihumi TaxID=400774 RepID=A0ABN2RXC3_9ACTN